MNIYKREEEGKPEEYEVLDDQNPLKGKNIKLIGNLRRRAYTFRNETKKPLTKEELKEHLRLTKRILYEVINDIEQIGKKL